MRKQNIILFFLFVVSLSVTVSLFLGRKTFEDNYREKSLESIKSEITCKVKEISGNLKTTRTKAEDYLAPIADNFNSDNPDYNSLPDQLKKSFEKNEFSAIGAFFSDDYNKDTLERYLSEYSLEGNGTKLFAPFFIKGDSETKVMSYDYRGADQWYDEKLSGGSWTGPYYGQDNGRYVISYRVPLSWDVNRNKNRGVICADFSLEYLRDVLGDIRLLNSGYGMMVTSEGEILSHPIKAMLGKNISELEGISIDSNFINNSDEKTFYLIRSQNPKVNKRKYVYFESISPMPEQKWWLVMVLDEEEVLNYKIAYLNEDQILKKKKRTHCGNEDDSVKMELVQSNFLSENHVKNIILRLSGGMSVFLLCSFLISFFRLNIWWDVMSISVICLILTIMVLNLKITSSVHSTEDETILRSPVQIEGAINKLIRSRKEEKRNTALERLKVGFFIQSVKFSSANDVFVRGYIWQKPGVKQSNDDDVVKFTFPEAEELNLTKVYSDSLMTRWSFTALLRQAFDYTFYPFDEESVWIRVAASKSYEDSVIIIPDLDAYPAFSAESRLGLPDELLLSGWHIRETSFSWRSHKYNSNFGSSDPFVENAGKPEMYFNIVIQREFWGVFVAYMIPLVIVAFLLFAVLMIRTRDENRNTWLGFSASTVLGYCSSLFFVLIVSHMSMRETLEAKGIIYLEYYFFILYIILALVSVNSVLYSYMKKEMVYSIHRNSWSRIELYFWPGILISILAVTVVTFI